MSGVAAALAGLACAAGYWLAGGRRAVLPGRGRTDRPRRRLPHRWRRRRIGAADGAGRAGEAAALAERLAGLARAGLPAGGSWQVLAAAAGPGRGTAATVAAMVRAGGSAAAGLRVAADDRGRVGMAGSAPLVWLSVAHEVVERTGAPVARVLDGFAEAARGELEHEQQRAVALAGPRATAAILTALPLAAPVLGMLTGADPLRVLAHDAAGRWCLVCGAALWLTGRWWTARLVAGAAGAGR